MFLYFVLIKVSLLILKHKKNQDLNNNTKSKLKEMIQKIEHSISYMEAQSLSELIPMIFNTGLTHLGSEASIYTYTFV